MVGTEITIKKFKTFMIFGGILLYIPIYILFFQSKGLTMEEISLIKMASFLTVIILEVPSGLLADRINPKFIILIAFVCYILSCFINIFSNNFIILMVSSFFGGAGMAFMSGADEAWFYEYLLSVGMEDSYMKITGEISFIRQIITAFGLIISSPLFLVNSNVPYALNAIVFMVAMVVVCSIKKGGKIEKQVNQTEIGRIKIIINNLLKNNLLSVIFASSMIFIAFTIFLFDTYQLKLTDLKFPVKFNGILYWMFVLVSGFAAKKVYLVRK